MRRLQGSIAVSAGIFVSRVIGLVRESVVRGAMGLGFVADAFTVGLRVPNLIQNLLGEGVLSASFIPVYSSMVDDDEERAGRLAGTVAAFLIVVSAPLVALGMIFARPISELFLLGRPDDRTVELSADLTRIMTPGIALLVLSAWSLGVLNSHRRFFLPYAAPVVWSLAQIAVVYGPDTDTVRDLAVNVAWATTIGAALQFAIQLPALRRVNPHIGKGIDPNDPAFRDVVRRFGPVIVGRGSAQISALVDLTLAGFLAAGALGAIAAAQVLYLLPISLFAMSVAAAELPEMSRHADDRELIASRLAAALQNILFFMLFTTLALIIAGTRIVGAVYRLFPRSEFSADEVLLVAIVLAAYALGLLAIGASRLMQNAFYALDDLITPARIAIVRYGISALVGVVLMLQFDRLFVYDEAVTGINQLLAPLEPLSASIRGNDQLPLRLGAAGLAAGAAVGAWYEFAQLRLRLLDHLGTATLMNTRWRPLVLPGLVATLVMLVLMPITSALHDVFSVAIVVGTAGVMYVMLSARNGVTAARSALGRSDSVANH